MVIWRQSDSPGLDLRAGSAAPQSAAGVPAGNRPGGGAVPALWLAHPQFGPEPISFPGQVVVAGNKRHTIEVSRFGVGMKAMLYSLNGDSLF